ncbi:hypothetical protein BSL78_18543 [Apostichopus japonicus]|uniref:Uncharacterized protein n=1 Tax=Stichopus japonicus TaxID=307972 RepID=A0A2G8K9F4_STIJA|nr:hypothetical protein BSL78_18543 [Apostichopus japonicus]
MPRRADQSRRFFASKTTPSGRPQLVILGTGWGSYSVLKNINKKVVDVIVISPRNHFLFTPLLCSTTVGTLEFRSIIEPVRNTGFRNPEHFHHAEAVGLNIEKQVVTCRSSLKNHKVYDVPYDKLVIGVGAVSNTFNVPGVKEHAFFLKEVSDARGIRNRILSNFELALQPGTSLSEKKRLLHIVIVGGGPTGVEFGAELYDFVKQDVSRLYREEQLLVRVSLIEGRKILSAFNQKLQQYAEKKIKARGQMELIQSNVIDVTSDSVTLQDGSVFPCGLVVWSTGLAPRPFVESIDFPKTPAGQILTDGNLRVKGEPSGNVFAIGDCADIEGEGLPCSAQVAERQGRYLAECLSKDNHSQPFKYQSMGMLAYVGDYKAVSDTPALKTQGFNSWILWRSAYLTRLGSWRLRMQVPLDWTKTMLFGRDTSQF